MPDPALIVVIGLLLATTEIAVTRHYGLALASITPLALLAAHRTWPTPSRWAHSWPTGSSRPWVGVSVTRGR